MTIWRNEKMGVKHLEDFWDEGWDDDGGTDDY